jgi:hypothetical protein
MPVFQSLENAHVGGAFYAVLRDDCTDPPETCRKGHRWCKNGDAALSSSLFICIQKKSSLTGAKHERDENFIQPALWAQRHE